MRERERERKGVSEGGREKEKEREGKREGVKDRKRGIESR